MTVKRDIHEKYKDLKVAGYKDYEIIEKLLDEGFTRTEIEEYFAEKM